MRKSALRTTAAVLRNIIGLKNTEMAELCGCSVDTIKSVEGGRIPISDTLATKMAHETGVSLGWLLKNDPRLPAVTESGKDYDREEFIIHAQGAKLFDRMNPDSLSMEFMWTAWRLRRLLSRANRSHNIHMCMHKLNKAFSALESEFKDNPLLMVMGSSGGWKRNVVYEKRTAPYEEYHADTHPEIFANAVKNDADLFLFRFEDFFYDEAGNAPAHLSSPPPKELRDEWEKFAKSKPGLLMKKARTKASKNKRSKPSA